ncbi:methylthioadenosine phosphorylase [Nitrosomonas sp. PY1]|uniref:S-methyl-5'-thioinosine phosphorylase n=1 Tax=Nitrosomonas sp. PY1 TaxID=1803906 RepID=UPI001FC7CE95|nr:S-methyl-5'-thioinosine phosphorylase [Nitrosomonas sp. PY1]GKS69224.1 methylthioadenosine phosphorylase [Nitrosomonas sp. PY1]
MLAIIGGNGMAQLPGLEIFHRQIIRTPYGEPSGPFTFGKIRNHEVAFLGRHGHNFTIPPHAINYRANICALHSLQPSHVIAITSVRGIRSDLAPGRLVIPNQIIDYTHNRKFTFFEDTEQRFKQADFTIPYSEPTRALLLQGAHDANLEMLDGGVYAATQGPRLETAAEINRLERDGADMVGMTGMPEAILAREMELNYATIAVVVSYAAGRNSHINVVDCHEGYEILEQAMTKVRKILEYVVSCYGD